MEAKAIVFEDPGRLKVRQLALMPPGEADVVVETLLSGISTGTEKMLFDGSMPAFPGMQYPLVPGYESVARVVYAGSKSGHSVGDTVFAPGASCFQGAAGLFGASASQLVLPGHKAIPVPHGLSEDAVLLALAATAHHAVIRADGAVDLIVGHGVLGRLIARIANAFGQEPPQVLETCPERAAGAKGYSVLAPDDAGVNAMCGTIIDASGDPAALDPAIRRLAKGGKLVLAGFYGGRVGFDFPSAFMREISLTLSAEFTASDIQAVLDLIAMDRLTLSDLVTHRAAPADAEQAYRTAFGDPACLKMVIDWRAAA